MKEPCRPGDFSPRDRVLARAMYERMVSSGRYQFTEAMQDSMLGLKKLYEAIVGRNSRINGGNSKYMVGRSLVDRA